MLLQVTFTKLYWSIHQCVKGCFLMRNEYKISCQLSMTQDKFEKSASV